jgi:hypothetical protein
MKSIKLLGLSVILTFLLSIYGCGGGSSSPSTPPKTAPNLVSIAVTPPASTVAPGAVVQFSALGTFSDGTTQDVSATVGWGSSSLSVAIVSDAPGSKGSATAVAGGTTTITATVGSISGSATLTVTGPALASITVTPANLTLPAGAVQQYTATGTFSGGSTQDMTALVTWTSSNVNVATVSDIAGSKGSARAAATGVTTLAATLGNITGSTTLTVTGPTLVSISVTPTNFTIVSGSALQFTATGTFSDGSSHDVTATATWTSSATSVATVSDAVGSKGAASAVATGTTTITATIGAVSGSTTLNVSGGAVAGANLMPITVDGSLCLPATTANIGYFNKPCVSVTVCDLSGTSCQTINDILLDTGSFGLRIFKQAIPNLTLSQVSSGTGALTECVQFADGSSVWGPVQLASVQLANEPPVQVPIQVIDASFGTRPTPCANADPTPVTAGYTGILGVGVFQQDCGPGCASSTTNGIYYTCTGASCSGAAVTLPNQVQNPVAQLPQDNNGVLVQLPAVPTGGVASINGSLFLGIGTQGNNIPLVPTVLHTNSSGDFSTTFNGVTTTSFLDTGSNALFIPNLDPLHLPPCASPNSEWYCPSGTTTFSATTTGFSGSVFGAAPSVAVSFKVTNALTLFNSSNFVFSDVAGNSTFGFDWGLPFFMGRSVFIGFSGKSGIGTTGPYVAY